MSVFCFRYRSQSYRELVPNFCYESCLIHKCLVQTGAFFHLNSSIWCRKWHFRDSILQILPGRACARTPRTFHHSYCYSPIMFCVSCLHLTENLNYGSQVMFTSTVAYYCEDHSDRISDLHYSGHFCHPKRKTGQTLL